MASQLKKKWFGAGQVDGEKIKLLAGQTLKAESTSGTEVDLLSVDGTGKVFALGSEVGKKSEIDQVVSDLASEVSRATIAEGVLDDKIDQEIADRISGDSSTLSSANTYTDGKVAIVQGEVDAVEASLATEVSDRISGDASTLSSANTYTDGKVAIVQGEVDAAEASIAQEILDRQTAITAVEDALDLEISDRLTAEAGLQSQIDAISGGGSGSISALQAELDATQVGAGLESDGTYLPPVGTYFLDAETSIKSAMIALDVAVGGVESNLNTEIQDRQTAVSDLQDQINSVLSNVDGAALDSLTEIVSAFQAADASLNGAITALSTGLSADIDAEESARIAADSAEASARQSADNALDARLDVLEAVVWYKEKFVISNGQTSITLSFAPKANSMSAFVDRLAIHEGASEDYTISGTTMTFLNDLVSPGQSQLGNGDTVYVKYQK